MIIRIEDSWEDLSEKDFLKLMTTWKEEKQIKIEVNGIYFSGKITSFKCDLERGKIPLNILKRITIETED